MILETTKDDYVRLIRGQEPRYLSLPDTPVAPTAVLEMLAGIASSVWISFLPASWLIIENDEVVGLCSITRPPRQGVIDIGYGVAPSRQGRGAAGRAIAEIIVWAKCRADVLALTGETSTANVASQRVLLRNGFVRIGERVDDEDGPLICWHCPTA